MTRLLDKRQHFTLGSLYKSLSLSTPPSHFVASSVSIMTHCHCKDFHCHSNLDITQILNLLEYTRFTHGAHFHLDTAAVLRWVQESQPLSASITKLLKIQWRCQPDLISDILHCRFTGIYVNVSHADDGKSAWDWHGETMAKDDHQAKVMGHLTCEQTPAVTRLIDWV